MGTHRAGYERSIVCGGGKELYFLKSRNISSHVTELSLNPAAKSASLFWKIENALWNALKNTPIWVIFVLFEVCLGR